MKLKYNKLIKLKNETDKCEKCNLYRDREKVVFGEGKLDAKLMFIGEAPGAEEDKLGIPFVGKAGRILNELLEGVNIDREEVYICNTVCCRPPGNKDPDLIYVKACKERLTKQIKIINPKIICALGRVATEWFLHTKKPMKERHGKVYKGRRLLFVTYHPAYAVHNPGNFPLLFKDFQKLVALLGRD